eukprot:scaffold1154_cov310-Pinguiococcus_pyrenoidosus.AAC.21
MRRSLLRAPLRSPLESNMQHNEYLGEHVESLAEVHHATADDTPAHAVVVLHELDRAQLVAVEAVALQPLVRELPTGHSFAHLEHVDHIVVLLLRHVRHRFRFRVRQHGFDLGVEHLPRGRHEPDRVRIATCGRGRDLDAAAQLGHAVSLELLWMLRRSEDGVRVHASHSQVQRLSTAHILIYFKL